MFERPPFQTLSHEVLIENSWHRYCRDRYVRADGTEGQYFYVDMPGSVGVIPLFRDGTTVLCRQYRYLLGVDLWEFPIGGVDRGDDLEETGRRELRQEAGLIAGRMIRLGAFAPYKGVSNERCHFFLARDLTEVGQDLEPEERIQVERMPLSDARARLFGQELLDGQSLCGWLLLERHLAAERGGPT